MCLERQTGGSEMTRKKEGRDGPKTVRNVLSRMIRKRPENKQNRIMKYLKKKMINCKELACFKS
jgi:hypothetical protein